MAAVLIMERDCVYSTSGGIERAGKSSDFAELLRLIGATQPRSYG